MTRQSSVPLPTNDPPSTAAGDQPYETPGWVLVLCIIAVVGLVAFVGLHLAGGMPSHTLP
jgi:hypothetical protein